MTGRQLPERDYHALKAAFRELVKLAGGQEAAARATRVGHQAMSRYGAATETDAFPPIDVVADLEAEVGEPIVTKTLADLSGRDLASREGGPRLSVSRLLAMISKETSDVVAGAVETLSDGVIDDAERVSLRREADEAIAALQAFREALDAGAER